ncbi:hypothetical protein GGTG_02075 [Gaeumannomyces tritici R3-111a-1]|uniref:VWFA domain-containing protein n=1 Tax=Gaeumannomyces tritici (strain R3-111a-1) TaxID=644352 RepID=J3NLC7_GAET3|nr:hypothetical protein GGTG_02075 [Gaeumannomyces tritici R3-111a-1]EJT82101.1 hypothetical protein GGTG_02075 [Gaeumannomyces tritici R3-111a-1]
MAIKLIVPIDEAGPSSAQIAGNHVPQPGGVPAPDPNQTTEPRPPPATDPEGLEFNVRPLSSAKGIMVKVQPPKAPEGVPADYHVPCDIVLVIDVSSSMNTTAVPPAREGEAPENHGFSTLDLVKHAALTILATLDGRDRLGIVKFSSKAKVVMELLPMTEENKGFAKKELLKLRPDGLTAIWDGIAAGFSVFEGKQDGSNRVPAIMFMTDGVPTDESRHHRGYVRKLQTVAPFPAPIHTFGFGYNLHSGTLKSISEVTGGHYAFIPDCGMIGTVFIHAVANLQSTYATEAQLKINFPTTLGLKAAMGKSLQISTTEEEEGPDSGQEAKRSCLTVGLGALQFGMSKDLYFEHNGEMAQLEGYLSADQTVAAELSYKTVGGERRTMKLDRNPFRADDPPEAEVAYHVSRSMLCNFLSSLFPFSDDDQRLLYAWGIEKTLCEDRIPIDSEIAARLDGVKRAMPAWGRVFECLDCKSLIMDVEGHEPNGQVGLALSCGEYWGRWGGHYLLGLLDAHARQACNSFKDPGPSRYGLASPLFAACRDRLDLAFDAVEPPTPCERPPPPYSSGGGVGAVAVSSHRQPYSMSIMYNNASAPCFAGDTRVRLAGAHAFLVAGPATDADSPPAALWGVCLGHGLVGRRSGEEEEEEEEAGDVRNHEFWGDHARVSAEMARLPRGGRDGVVLCGGVRRSRATGRTVGLRKPGPSRGLAKAGKAAAWKLRGRFVKAARSSRKGLVSAV